MLCKCSYFSQDAVTFNIKYTLVCLSFASMQLYVRLNELNQSKGKKPGHLVNAG